MADVSMILKFLLALVLGALIGLERERFSKNTSKNNFVFGGIRTFTFISLLGAVSAYLALIFSEWFILMVAFCLSIMLVFAYNASVKYSKGNSIGLTGEIVALLTFFFGVIVMTADMTYAVVLAIVTTVLLYGKKKLHSLIKTMSKDEMYSTLVFAIIAFVVLPFLPNQVFGPLGVFNPYQTWLMIVFIAGLSYIGYILIKIFGSKRGIGLAGVLGGLVSSTAVTMAFAANSKKDRRAKMVNLFVFGALLANAVMFVRVIIEVYVVNKSILPALLIPMSVMCLVAVLGAIYLWVKRDKFEKTTQKHSSVEHVSPLSLEPAVKFGLLFVAVLFAVKLAQIYLGDAGLYLAGIISGFVDVDAITLSMASLAGTEISTKVAAMTITLAVMSNTIIKFIYASMFGSKAFRKKLGIVFSLVIIAGLISFLFV